MGMTPIDAIPKRIRRNYEVHEWRHATAILKEDFPREWGDILAVLSEFRLRRSEIEAPGGRKSPIACRIDEAFRARGWREKDFATQIVVDKAATDSPTHKVDCFRNGVALEIEWNNKDPSSTGISTTFGCFSSSGRLA